MKIAETKRVTAAIFYVEKYHKNKNKLLKICYNTKEFEKNIYISLETHKKKYNILVKKYKQTFTMNIKKSKLSVLTHKSYKKRNDTKHQK